MKRLKVQLTETWRSILCNRKGRIMEMVAEKLADGLEIEGETRGGRTT